MTSEASSIPNTDRTFVLIHGLSCSISFPVTTMLMQAYGGTQGITNNNNQSSPIHQSNAGRTQKKQKN
jgi:hypothetical protein